jgi:hypothetical protein
LQRECAVVLCFIAADAELLLAGQAFHDAVGCQHEAHAHGSTQMLEMHFMLPWKPQVCTVLAAATVRLSKMPMKGFGLLLAD